MTMRDRGMWVLAAILFVLTGCAQATASRAPATEPPRDTELPSGSFSAESAPPPPEEPQTVVRPRLSRTLTLGSQDNAAWTQEAARSRGVPGQLQPAFVPYSGPQRVASSRSVSPTRPDLFAEDAAQAPVTRRISSSGYRSLSRGAAGRHGSFGRSGGFHASGGRSSGGGHHR
jgi:hypothetical protein